MGGRGRESVLLEKQKKLMQKEIKYLEGGGIKRLHILGSSFIYFSIHFTIASAVFLILK